ncbi:MAG: hypothetical protein U0236_18340 [Nitrospira sp.]
MATQNVAGQLTTYTRRAGHNLLTQVTDALSRVTAYTHDDIGDHSQDTPSETVACSP